MTPERRMWAAAVLAWLGDWNREYWSAIKRGSDPQWVLDDARRYFSSRDGMRHAIFAGLEINHAAIAATISLPRDQFKARMTILPDSEANK